MVLAHIQESVFCCTKYKVVWDLVRDWLGTCVQKFLQVPGSKVANAIVLDFSCSFCSFERLYYTLKLLCIIHGYIHRPMDLIQINILGLEILKGLFNGFGDHFS